MGMALWHEGTRATGRCPAVQFKPLQQQFMDFGIVPLDAIRLLLSRAFAKGTRTEQQ
jgi:hypothetical protein